MATTLEKELRLIRERPFSIEDTLGKETSEDDRDARTEALREHREGKDPRIHEGRLLKLQFQPLLMNSPSPR